MFRALDWTRLDHLPPLAEPRQLPPGAGSAASDDACYVTGTLLFVDGGATAM